MNLINQELRISENGEKLIEKSFKVLDKGFVKLISYHGTDQLIEASARVSYQKGTRKINDTLNLIRFLYRNSHHSPLEMGNVTFHIKAPLFIIQQILRHRTAKLNQESHRYSEIKDEFYELGPNEWRMQSKDNKQGSNGVLPEEIGQCMVNEQRAIQEYAFQKYQNRLKYEVAKEIARKDIPHSTYSQLYWQIDLRNLFHFLKLRCDYHAQLEIRTYANTIASIVKQLFPISFEAWYDYSFCSSNFTRLDKLLYQYLTLECEGVCIDYIKRNYCQQTKDEDVYGIKKYTKEIGMSKREVDEFFDKFTFNEMDFDINKLAEIE